MNSQGAVQFDSKNCCCLSRRQCVIFIALLETVGSLCGIGGFWYSYYVYPSWKVYVGLSDEIMNDTIILGMINTLIILCGCAFLLSLVLLDGAIHVKLGQIKFWLTSMLTYKVVTSILVVGMQMGGCKAPRLNAFIFISVFLGFVEMLYVYVFLEEETYKRKIKTKELLKEGNLSRVSTVCSFIENDDFSSVDSVPVIQTHSSLPNLDNVNDNNQFIANTRDSDENPQV